MNNSTSHPTQPHTKSTLYEISNIHWHFINLCTVVLLNISQDLDVITLDKVDCNTLQTMTRANHNYVCEIRKQVKCWEQNNYNRFWVMYLASKTSRSTNTMNIKLSIIWEVIVYNKRNLITEYVYLSLFQQ